MKVLAKHKDSSGYLLIQVSGKTLGELINGLIRKGRYPQAIAETLSRGRVMQNVSESEKPSVEADLIITEDSAHWDLT